MGAQRGQPGADLPGGPRAGSRHGNGVGSLNGTDTLV